MKGHKRHLAVDTAGCWGVATHAVSVQDQVEAPGVLERLRQAGARLQVTFASAAYRRRGVVEQVRERFGWNIQTMLRPVGLGVQKTG